MKKKIAIIIIAVILILSGAAACIYFFTPWFKPANKVFSAQAKKLFGANNENSEYDKYERALEKLKASKSTSSVEMSADVKLPTSTVDQKTQDLINSSTLKITSSVDKDAKKASANIELQKDNNKVLSLDGILDGGKVTVGSEELYNKFLTFDLDKMEGFATKNNIALTSSQKTAIKTVAQVMKNAYSSNTLYDLLYISKDDYKDLKKTYSNLLENEKVFSKDSFSKKSKTVKVNGKEVKTTAYTLRLNGKSLSKAVAGIAKIAKDDDTLKDLIIKKYDIISEAMKDMQKNLPASSYSSLNSLPKLTEDNIDLALNYIIAASDSLENWDGYIDATIYSKGNEPARFELTVKPTEDIDAQTIFVEELSKGKTKYTLDIESVLKLTGNSTKSSTRSNSYNSYNSLRTTTNKSAINNITDSVKKSVNSVSKIVLLDDYKGKKDDKKGTLTVSAENDSESVDFLTVDYETKSSKKEEKMDLTIKSPKAEDASIHFLYDAKDLNSDKPSVDLALSGEYKSYKVGINVKASEEINKADIKDLNASNSVDVFSSSKEDLQKVYNDIIDQASTALPSKLSQFGVNITKEQVKQMLSGSTTTTAVTPVTPTSVTLPITAAPSNMLVR